MNLWRVERGLRPVAWFAAEADADQYAEVLTGRGELGVRVRPTTAAETASTLTEAERARLEHEDWLASRRDWRDTGRQRRAG